jgi:hypothetical protein
MKTAKEVMNAAFAESDQRFWFVAPAAPHARLPISTASGFELLRWINEHSSNAPSVSDYDLLDLSIARELRSSKGSSGIAASFESTGYPIRANPI